MLTDKKRILLFADWYEPGYRAGGPIRSCVNFANHMQGEYQVYVFTSDRDLNDDTSYSGIPVDQWITSESGVQIYYSSPANRGLGAIRRQMKEIAPDFVYLNSMFSVRFTILPLLAVRMDRIKAKIILSPRGMLRESAVRFKSRKKLLFLRLFRQLGFSRRVHFLASDLTEGKDVQHYFGQNAQVTIIGNFPSSLPGEAEIANKHKGELTMVCIGRIHPIKNTDYLLDVLGGVRADVRLSIVGSTEDQAFWQECQAKIRQLPANVTVAHLGELPNHELPSIISQHHIFVLPTKGENFGHAIFEALVLGKPVLISDQTPWLNLAAVRAGWDLPLARPESFREAIEAAADLEQQEYAEWCNGARRYAEAYLNNSDIKHAYLKLFC